MKNGDTVRVYPHGSPEQGALATVELISENQRSIALVFEDNPPFLTAEGGVFILPGRGITMLARREALNGMAWGPWIELTGGGHYEIEEALG